MGVPDAAHEDRYLAMKVACKQAEKREKHARDQLSLSFEKQQLEEYASSQWVDSRCSRSPQKGADCAPASSCRYFFGPGSPQQPHPRANLQRLQPVCSGPIATVSPSPAAHLHVRAGQALPAPRAPWI